MPLVQFRHLHHGLRTRCNLVRAAGIEPAQAVKPYGFSYHFGFRRLALRLRGQASSWSGLSLHPSACAP